MDKSKYKNTEDKSEGEIDGLIDQWKTYSKPTTTTDGQEDKNAGEKKLTQLLIDAKSGRLSKLRELVEGISLSRKRNEKDDRKFSKDIFLLLKSILRLTTENSIGKDELVEVVHWVHTEARNFPSGALTSTVSYITKLLSDDPPEMMIEIFTKLVIILSMRGGIYTGNDTVEGNDYKVIVINDLCSMKWSSNSASHIIFALREIDLDTEKKQQVLLKAQVTLKNLAELGSDSVPPIAHQLLLMCGETNVAELIDLFNGFFHDVKFEDTESFLEESKRIALGTTVFHFIQYAKNSEKITMLREVNKRLRDSLIDQSYAVNPFMLALALGFTIIEKAKTSIIDYFKNTIMKCYEEYQLTEDTSWYKSVKGEAQDDVGHAFISVTNSKTDELDFMFEGLKDLGLSLMGVVSKDIYIVEKCGRLGSTLITSILRKNKDYFPMIMTELLKCQTLMASECLEQCLRIMTVNSRDFSQTARLYEIIHCLPSVSVELALPIIRGLIVSLQLNPNLMSQMMITLIKTTWKSDEAKKVAVTALTYILSRSELTGELVKEKENSQSSSQGGVESQYPPNTNSTMVVPSDSLCSEVFAVIKRFLAHPYDVREYIYLGHNFALAKNPNLIIGLCENLLGQIKTHMAGDEANLLSMVDCKEGSVVILEDIGLLLHTILHHLVRGEVLYKNANKPKPKVLEECETVLVVWKNFILQIRPEEVETIPNSTFKPEIIKHYKHALWAQLMEGVEALILFRYLRRTEEPESKAPSRELAHLFRKFQTFRAHLTAKAEKKDGTGAKKKKSPAGGGKTGGGKKKANTTVGGNQSTAPAGTSKGDAVVEKPKVLMSKIVWNHSMTFHDLYCIIKDLYGDILPPRHVLEKVVKDADFELFILEILRDKLGRLRVKETNREKCTPRPIIMEDLSYISSKLLEKSQSSCSLSNAIVKNEEPDVILEEEDNRKKLQEKRFELIFEITDYLFNEFPTTKSSSTQMAYDGVFKKFFNSWRTMLRNSLDSSKGIQDLFGILNNFCKTLSASSESAAEVYKRLSEIVQENEQMKLKAEPNLCSALLNSMIIAGAKALPLPGKILEIAQGNNAIIGPVVTGEGYNEISWIITPETGPCIVTVISNYIDKTLGLINKVIAHIKSQAIVKNDNVLQDSRDKMKTKITKNLHFLAKIMCQLVKSGVSMSIDQVIGSLLKILPKFYSTLIPYTDLYIENSKYHKMPKGFTDIIRFVGTDLRAVIDELIQSIEVTKIVVEVVQVVDEDKSGKKKRKGKGTTTTKTAGQKKKKEPKTLRMTSNSREAVTIPNLIFIIEKYEQRLVSLGNKSKVNLLSRVKTGAARDFRMLRTRRNELSRVDEPPSTSTTTTSSSISHVANNKKKTQPKKKTRAREPTIDEVDEDPAEQEEEIVSKSGKKKRRQIIQVSEAEAEDSEEEAVEKPRKKKKSS